MRSWFRISALGMLTLFAVLLPESLAQQVQSDGNRRIVSQITPDYPSIARRLRLTGMVRISATVGPNGKVVRTEVLGGNPVFAQSATTAVSKFKWEPRPDTTKELVQITFQ
jgi:TonB family protein